MTSRGLLLGWPIVPPGPDMDDVGGYIDPDANLPAGVRTALALFAVTGYANVGSRYAMTPHVKGGLGTRVFSLSGSLPAGLSFSSVTGAIVGTPTTAGTYSGFAITVTDASGFATSNTFSIQVGAAAVAIAPSGDTTGATDIAAINAALASGQSVILSGLYYANNTIRQPSNTAIYCNTGEWRLVAASNCRLWCNTNQDTRERIDNNLSVVGDGAFWFNGQPALQIRQTNARFNHGFDVISANNVMLAGFGLVANASSLMILGGTYSSQRDLVFMCDTATINQDGLDIGPGCHYVGASGMRGCTGDDAFSFFAKAAVSDYSFWKGTPWEGGADTSNIFISDTKIICNSLNLFRLQAGDGYRLMGVYAQDSNNTNLANTVCAVQIGEAVYILSQPKPTDYRNVVMEGISGCIRWLYADTHFQGAKFYDIDQNVPLYNGVASKSSNLVISNVLVDGVAASYTGGVTHKKVVNFPTGNVVSNITVKNVAISALTSVLDTVAPINGMYFEDVAVTTALGTLFASATPSTGTVKNVTLAKSQADVGTSGLTVASGPANMSSIVVTSAPTGAVLENYEYVQALYANQVVTFAKLPGADSALFTLSSPTNDIDRTASTGLGWSGATLRLAAMDYDAPLDADANNVYVCNLKATDAAGNVLAFSVSVTVRNDAVERSVQSPIITAYLAQRSVALTAPRLVAYKQLIQGLYDDALLFTLGRLFVFADQQNVGDSLINIMSPSGTRATLPLSGTFTADRGIQLDGTTQEINLGGAYTADGKYTQSSATFGVWCNLQGAATGSKPHMGSVTTDTAFFNASDNSTEPWRVNNPSSLTGRTGTTRVGHRAGNRSASNANRMYYAGVAEKFSTNASTTPPASNATVGRNGATYAPDRFAAAYTGSGTLSERGLRMHLRMLTFLSLIGAA